MGFESVAGPVANCVVAGSISTVGGSSVASSVGSESVSGPVANCVVAGSISTVGGSSVASSVGSELCFQ